MTEVVTTRRKAMSAMRRLKIWEAHGGICILCKMKISGGQEAWTVEHVIPLGLGGKDEDDNCGPAHETCRRVKDKTDVADIARAKRRKAKTIGIKKPTTFRKPPAGYGYSWKLHRYVKL